MSPSRRRVGGFCWRCRCEKSRARLWLVDERSFGALDARDPWPCVAEGRVCRRLRRLAAFMASAKRRSPVERADLEQRPRLTLADESRQDQQFEKCDVAVGGDRLGKRNLSRRRRDAIDGDNGQPWSLAVAMAELRRKLLDDRRLRASPTPSVNA